MPKISYRIEKDSLGEVKVPRKALWGAQTQRAVDNFPISGIKMDFPFTNSFVDSLGLINVDIVSQAPSSVIVPRHSGIINLFFARFVAKIYHQFPPYSFY